MKTKILTATILLFLIIGIGAATDINNLKVPDGWGAVGGGSYHEVDTWTNGGSGRNMMIQESFDDLENEFCTNLTDENYYAYANSDNTYNYTDGLNQDSGCFEVVQIDGKDYFVLFSTNDDYEFNSDTPTTYSLMMEFNKLNNLQPVAI